MLRSLLVLCLLASPANADIVRYFGKLNSDDYPVRVPSNATGYVGGLYDTDLNTLTLNWRIQDLVGTPGPPGAHVHIGKPGEIGNISFVMFDDAYPLRGSIVWSALSFEDQRNLRRENFYVNFHTDFQFFLGETRAQLYKVPSPGSALSLSGGIAVLSVRRRRINAP